MCRGWCRGNGHCPDCNPEYAALMKMDSFEYSAWLTLRTAEHAAARGIRVAASADDVALDSMAAFRRSLYDTAFAVLEPATSRVHLEPPDPYESGLEQLRKELR